MKEKKKQKLIKAGFEARARARKEKEREKEERDKEERQEEEERDLDLDGWARKRRSEHEVYFFSVWSLRLTMVGAYD